jgi:hypothetical protein
MSIASLALNSTLLGACNETVETVTYAFVRIVTMLISTRAEIAQIDENSHGYDIVEVIFYRSSAKACDNYRLF